MRRDADAKSAVERSKNDFYSKYSYLKPECEKNVFEHICDGIVTAAKWCKEHWKLIVTAIIVVVAVVLLCTGVGSGLGAVLLAGACWGAIMGACIGGVAGGLESMANGGSFLDGFEEGAFSGAISGAITGAACAGLGALGGAAGNFVKCGTALGKAIKGTAAVTKVLSIGMGGFDTLAMADRYFGNGDIAALNSKLHESTAYNVFQTGVTALAIFTGGMTSTMKCFVAGTMILTADGLVAIENIKAGDMVLSRNPETGEISYKKVEVSFVNHTNKLAHVTVNGETIVSTHDHPYYVKNHGFVNACDLWIGAELIDRKGVIHPVEHIYRENLGEDSVNVYNFKVEDYHTYFVGNNCVWVHNAECTIEFTNKSGLDEKKFKKQLKTQQDGFGDLTIDEYRNSRQAYNQRKIETGSGRDPNSAKYQNQFRKKAIAAKTKEFRKQGYSLSEAESKAKSWAKGKAALHAPDQIVGGKADSFSGLGDSKINSSIGSQWKSESRIGKLDSYINEKAATLPGNTKLSELDNEFVLK